MVKGTAELQRPIPLYMQVVRQLRAQIASGDLTEGERIPSQREMMQHWRISMQTASKVIGALKTEGLAIPSIGRDTIVAPGAAARLAAISAGTAQAAPELREGTSYEVSATAELTAPSAEVAELLGIPAGRSAIRRREIHLDNGNPLSVTVNWFPPAITAKAPHLADNKPLPAGALAYLAEITDYRSARVVEERAALGADADAATTLGVSPGSPVFVTKARHYDTAGQLIAYMETTVTAGNWRRFSYTVTGVL